jgi:hypothetical protein
MGVIKYLVSRAFQRTEMVNGRTGSQVATQEEAQWHFLNFVQYMSISEQQRKRQAKLAYLFAAETALNSNSNCAVLSLTDRDYSHVPLIKGA